MAFDEARAVFGNRISYAETAEECLRSAGVTIVINPMDELERIDWRAASASVVMDPWRCLPQDAIALIGTYVAMGRGNGVRMNEWLAAGTGDGFRLLNS
jgi:hypothetical protein